MTLYRVKDWDAHFENHKSRTVERCSYVCVPNKQHGAGLTHILALPDGLAIYGLFNLILGACSQHVKPRTGWLTNTGREDGTPWTAAYLALRWRRIEAEIVRAIDVLSSPSVGWIDVYVDGALQAPFKCPSGAAEWKGMEGKGIEGKEPAAQACAEVGRSPASAPSDPPAERSCGKAEGETPAVEAKDDPVAIDTGGSPLVFPIRVLGKGKHAGEATWPLRESKLAEYTVMYPELDVPAQFMRARFYCQNNPTKRKTYDGMLGFLTRWCNRAMQQGDTRTASRNGRTNGEHRETSAERRRREFNEALERS